MFFHLVSKKTSCLSIRHITVPFLFDWIIVSISSSIWNKTTNLAVNLHKVKPTVVCLGLVTNPTYINCRNAVPVIPDVAGFVCCVDIVDDLSMNFFCSNNAVGRNNVHLIILIIQSLGNQSGVLLSIISISNTTFLKMRPNYKVNTGHLSFNKTFQFFNPISNLFLFFQIYT